MWMHSMSCDKESIIIGIIVSFGSAKNTPFFPFFFFFQREREAMGTTKKKGEDQKALLWRLPEVASAELGKIGPAFGVGIGCGAGAGVGFFGGAGLGYGFPGLTLGFGVGAGCGVGFGFGYGLGKGIAYDDKKRYSNVGKMFQEAPNLPMDTIVGLVDELVVNTKKFARATSKEIEKWR
ncbi:hypothetical protein GUJ93_ZPchr0011g28749 [Zizania palustris]|uniref:Uncharacterized protein n=1 Tax=Zizania palustris TaxID=103762 RepID=A0A8J5WJA3_ZIZPA|nr:hypothetical protein GUJ93_ZPchr0011g28749 [Zizania palustris]